MPMAKPMKSCIGSVTPENGWKLPHSTCPGTSNVCTLVSLDWLARSARCAESRPAGASPLESPSDQPRGAVDRNGPARHTDQMNMASVHGAENRMAVLGGSTVRATQQIGLSTTAGASSIVTGGHATTEECLGSGSGLRAAGELIPCSRTACRIDGVSQQPGEFLHAKPRLPDDCPQGAPVQLRVVGSDDLREGLVPANDHLAPMLPLQVEPHLAERFDAGSPRDPRQPGHTATTMASKRSSGTASPSSSREATYPSIASLMLAMASSLVFP